MNRAPEVPIMESDGSSIRVREWAKMHRAGTIDRAQVCEALRIKEAQGLDDFSAFTDVIDRGIATGLSSNTVRTTYQTLGMRRNSRDFSPMHLYDCYGTMLADEVPENANYPSWNAADAVYTLVVKKYGWEWPLSMEGWLRDNRDLGLLAEQPVKWGLSAAYTREFHWTSLWAQNATFFTAGNGNYDTGAATPWYLFCDPLVRPAAVWGQVTGFPDAEVFIKESDARAMIGGSGADPFSGTFSTDSVRFKLRFTYGAVMLHPSAAYRSQVALSATSLGVGIDALKHLPDPAGNVNAYLGKINLVVPPGLEFTARNLVESRGIVIAGTAGAVTVMGEDNALAASCTVVVNDFLPSLDAII
jgi:hypothetical protein